jgi:flagellar hook-associated protein 2
MTTTSATSATNTATQQLLTSLGSGSGVDTGSLVTSLVQAEFAGRTDALAKRADALTAQLSGVSTLKSTMSQFSAALASLTTGGTLTTQLSSSDAGVLTAAAKPGAAPSAGTRSITVNRLAAGQTAQTTATDVTDRTAHQFSGTLTINVGRTAVAADGTATTTDGKPVTVTLANASLDEVARAISASAAGVKAAVVTDADGTAYLSMTGATGAANGFTVTAADAADTTHTLAMFDVGSGTGAKATAAAADADLTVDGVHVTRASNTVADLVDGATLTLAKAGTVTLTGSVPTNALTQAVGDVVDTYNQVLSAVTTLTDPVSGALRGDPAAKSLLRQLKTLASATLLPGAAAGAPRSLAELGVGTNRDGTLKVDAAALSRAVTAHPSEVEAMFAPAAAGSSDGIAALMAKIASAATDKGYGLGASEATYTAQQTTVTKQQSDLSVRADAETKRLTQQFASMNSKVSAYKATQTFLTNQIDAWNKSDG